MIKGLASIKEGKDFLHVSYEDSEVEQFGGGDYEVNYSLDGQNKEKQREVLARDGLKGTLEDMILEHFGEYLDKDAFSTFCDRNGIKYDLFTWVS